jgi:hypothetical protein
VRCRSTPGSGGFLWQALDEDAQALATAVLSLPAGNIVNDRGHGGNGRGVACGEQLALQLGALYFVHDGQNMGSV